MPESGLLDEQPASAPPRRPRRQRWPALVAVATVVALLIGWLVVRGRPGPVPPLQPTPAPTAQPPTSRVPRPPLPQTMFGFYSAGFRKVECYGFCSPDQKAAYGNQEHNRRRMAELQRMHVNYVVNSLSIRSWFAKSPQAVVNFLDDLHRHGIRTSYAVASSKSDWFADGKFDPTKAQEKFAETDLDRDGVSDLDGKLDVLYQGHEVLEWLTHRQRVEAYRVAKKWFPTTPVSVYYAGFLRPFQPGAERAAHRGGPGGVWRDYAYGPDEADIVHVGVRKDAIADESAPGRNFDVQAFGASVREHVAVVQRLTPGTPVVVSTSFAGDDRMDGTPDSMWSPQQITEWFTTTSSIRGVRGVLLRSYARFRYDLGNEQFAAQRETWARLGRQVAARAGAL